MEGCGFEYNLNKKCQISKMRVFIKLRGFLHKPQNRVRGFLHKPQNRVRGFLHRRLLRGFLLRGFLLRAHFVRVFFLDSYNLIAMGQVLWLYLYLSQTLFLILLSFLQFEEPLFILITFIKLHCIFVLKKLHFAVFMGVSLSPLVYVVTLKHSVKFYWSYKYDHKNTYRRKITTTPMGDYKMQL